MQLDTSKARAIHITNPKFWLPNVSATFHGRDIFAPVAAHLSLGVNPADFGEVIDNLVTLPSIKPHRESRGTLVGQVIHVDHFGNLITNIKEADLPDNRDSLVIGIKRKRINGLVKTYDDAESLCALIGSSGFLEIALKNGSAAKHIGTAEGDEVRAYTNS